MDGGVDEPPAVFRVEVDFVEGKPPDESLERWLDLSDLEKLLDDKRRRSLRKLVILKERLSANTKRCA